MTDNNSESKSFELYFFESPIAQFEEDYSKVKKYLDNIISKNRKKIGNRKVLKDFFDNNPEEIRKISKMINIVKVNKKAVEIYGAKNQEELLVSVDKFVASYDHIELELLDFYDGKTVFEADVLNYKVNKEIIHARLQILIVPEFKDDWSKVLVSIIDITELKEAQSERKDAEKKYYALFSALPIAIGIANLKGEFIEYNSTLLQLLGYNRTTIKAITALDTYMDPKDRNIVLKLLKENPNQLVRKEVYLKRSNGDYFPSYLNLQKLDFQGQEVILSAFNDSTEINKYRKNLEELVNERTNELIHSNEELMEINKRIKRTYEEMEEFVYTLSHDLKNPLTSISGFNHLIEMKIKERDLLNDELITFFDRIHTSVEKMDRIINDILEYSRIGRVTEVKISNSLNTLVSEVITSFQPRLDQADIDITVESGMPTIFAERRRIIQVFENLVDNAIKYMNPQNDNKEISIGIESKTRWNVTCYVKDNGIGIDKKYEEKLFGLFTRIPNELTQKVSGSGIGLANVKKIINHHGGKVWIKSDKGKGTTIYFTLPRR